MPGIARSTAARRPAGERGQALVEFALVLPLLLFLIFAVIDFGRALNYKNDITSLANQAARYAEVNSCAPCGTSSIDGPTGYIRTLADSGNLQNGVKVQTCFPPGSTGAVGQPVTATVSDDYSWLPFLGFAKITISSSVTVRAAEAWSSASPSTTDVYMQSGARTCT